MANWRLPGHSSRTRHPTFGRHHHYNIQYVGELFTQYVVGGRRKNWYDDRVVAILIWAHDAALGEALLEYLADPGRSIRVLDTDAELAATGADTSSLLVAQAGPRLAAQQAFLRVPFILVDPARRS